MKAFRQVMTALKDVNVQEEDVVILANDSKNSWRKKVDPEYKANRADLRAKYPIDWDGWFAHFDWLLEQFECFTPYHAVSIDELEADDIIAVGVKKFKNNDCIIISTDSDYEQLAIYPNVMLFSPLKQTRTGCGIKVIENPSAVIHKKIKKERTDNLLSPVQSAEDYERRDLIVNLLTLPEDIIRKVDDRLDMLSEKQWELTKLPYSYCADYVNKVYTKTKQYSL